MIVAANHRSLLDPLVIGSMTRRPMHFVAKAELFENRILGRFLTAAGAIPVRRGLGDRQTVDTAKSILARGGCVVIFPEGKRSSGPNLGRPKRGLGKIAVESGATIVPVAVAGTETPRIRHPLRLPKAVVSAGEPLCCQPQTADSSLQSRSVLDSAWAQILKQWQLLTLRTDANAPIGQ